MRIGVASWAALLLLFVLYAGIGWKLIERLYFTPIQIMFEVVAAAISAYCIALSANVLRTTPADLRRLGPVLHLEPAEMEAESTGITRQSAGLGWWTAAWIAGTSLLTFWMLRDLAATPAEETGPLVVQPLLAGWDYLRNGIGAFSIGALIWIELSLARRLGAVIESRLEVDLLDRSGLGPLARRARRSVLLWIPLIPVAVTMVLVVIGILLYPALGVRRRYAEEKRIQLKAVRERIRQRSTSLVTGEAGAEASTVPELVAWEERLQSAKTWPYDLTTSVKVTIYVVVGLASWVGAALVERSLEYIMG